MKAAVLTGIRHIEIKEIPEPELKNEDDVLLKVFAIGICGSDLHYYLNGKIGDQQVSFPFRLGHEFSGIIKAVGKDVKSIKPGDRVAIDPAMACGSCDQCLSGRKNTCRSLRFLGCPGQAEGCLCEYLVMPQSCCYPLARHTTLEQAALAEPLSIGMYAVQLAAPILSASIGILGCGPIGLCVLMTAKTHGAENVYMTDKIKDRLMMAIKCGATWIGNPNHEDVVNAVASQEPMLLDVVFECCGQQEALDQAVDLLKPGGKLILIGIPETERISFPVDEIRRKEIRIQNIRRQNDCMRRAIDLIESSKVKIDSLITHRFSLEDTQKAFDMVAGYRDGVMKALINLD